MYEFIMLYFHDSLSIKEMNIIEKNNETKYIKQTQTNYSNEIWIYHKQ